MDVGGVDSVSWSTSVQDPREPEQPCPSLFLYNCLGLFFLKNFMYSTNLSLLCSLCYSAAPFLLIYLPKILPYFHISLGINYYLCPFVVIKALCLIPSPVKKTNKQTKIVTRTQTQISVLLFGEITIFTLRHFPPYFILLLVAVEFY